MRISRSIISWLCDKRCFDVGGTGWCRWSVYYHLYNSGNVQVWSPCTIGFSWSTLSRFTTCFMVNIYSWMGEDKSTHVLYLENSCEIHSVPSAHFSMTINVNRLHGPSNRVSPDKNPVKSGICSKLPQQGFT
jgi:hypothetical protein